MTTITQSKIKTCEPQNEARTMEEVHQKLRLFNGTENYYRHWTKKLVYTDGVREMANLLEAYWLIDEIALAQLEKIISIFYRVHEFPFQVWEIKTDSNSECLIFCHDGTEEKQTLFVKRLNFTTLPEGELKLYLCDNVLLLPSEY